MVCLLVICYGSLMNAQAIPGLEFKFVDKLMHICAYTVLTGTLINAMYKNDVWSTKQSLVVLSSMTFYGIFIEILQKTMTESRNFDILDVVANVTGTVLAFLLFSTLLKQ